MVVAHFAYLLNWFGTIFKIVARSKWFRERIVRKKLLFAIIGSFV